MLNDFLDSYVRLKIFSGEKVQVLYYENGIKKELEGYLETVIGSDYIVCWNDNKKIKIPFYNDKCIIESIKLCNRDECCGQNDYIIFYNQYNTFSEENRSKLFGTDITYSSDDKIFDVNPYFRFPYKEMFSSEKQRKEFFEFLKVIIVELTDYCKKNNLNSELSFVGLGSTSIVLSIGDKIVKFGIKRVNELLPYCEYLLQPLFNRNFRFGDRIIHMEVTQKVRKGTKEAAEYLNNQLSLIGLQPNDIDSFNVGFLDSKSDNRIHYKDNIFYDVASDRATSIIENSNLHLNSDSSDKPFNGQFPVILDLADIEICDIDKYTEYLHRIGMNDETIKIVRENYLKSKKNRSLS